MLRMIDNKFVIGTSEDWNKHMTKTDITDQPLLKYVYLNLKLYTYILIYINTSFSSSFLIIGNI